MFLWTTFILEPKLYIHEINMYMQAKHINAVLQSLHAAARYLFRKCNFFCHLYLRNYFLVLRLRGSKAHSSFLLDYIYISDQLIWILHHDPPPAAFISYCVYCRTWNSLHVVMWILLLVALSFYYSALLSFHISTALEGIHCCIYILEWSIYHTSCDPKFLSALMWSGITTGSLKFEQVRHF